MINEETLRRAHAARADPEGAEKVWEKSEEAREEGKLGEWKDLSEIDLDRVLLVHRFPHWEHRAKGWRVRPIDNYKGNQANAYAVSVETSSVDGVDDLTAALVLFEAMLGAAGGGRRQAEQHQVLPTLGLDDFIGAFDTLPRPGASAGWRTC